MGDAFLENDGVYEEVSDSNVGENTETDVVVWYVLDTDDSSHIVDVVPNQTMDH